MSRYAWLICEECKICLWLGKALFEGDRLDQFKIGADPLPNPENALLNRVVWKIFADHAGHPLRVAVDPAFDAGPWREIGGDEEGDISVEEYLHHA